MTETVSITEVTNKGNGWYDIALDGDDRVLSTKDTKLAEIANASAGTKVEVEINSKEKGNFTNHYLQSINGEKGNDRPAPKKAGSTPTTNGSAYGKSDATQERIARQWAFGRSVELLVSSDREFSFPLDAETFADMKLQAQALLDATKS